MMGLPLEVSFLTEKLGIKGAMCMMSFDADIINTQKEYGRTGINQYLAEYINRYLFRSLLQRLKHWEFRVPTPYSYLQKCINKDLLPLSIELKFNKLVNNGLTEAAKVINGNSANFNGFQYNSIGTSNQAVVAGDEDLFAPVSPRKIRGESFEDGFTSLLEVLYGETENNNASLIQESGFFKSLTGTPMFNRQTFTGIDHSAGANTALTVLGAFLISGT